MVEHSFHYIIANDFNYINVTEPVPQLLGSFPEVFRQQMIQLSFISAEVSIPRQNIISIDVVKHCKKERKYQDESIFNTSLPLPSEAELYLKRLPIFFFNVLHFLPNKNGNLTTQEIQSKKKNYWRSTQKAHKWISSAQYLNRKSKELIPCLKTKKQKTITVGTKQICRKCSIISKTKFCSGEKLSKIISTYLQPDKCISQFGNQCLQICIYNIRLGQYLFLQQLTSCSILSLPHLLHYELILVVKFTTVYSVDSNNI